jgi:hypothetical protein
MFPAPQPLPPANVVVSVPVVDAVADAVALSCAVLPTQIVDPEPAFTVGVGLTVTVRLAQLVLHETPSKLRA